MRCIIVALMLIRTRNVLIKVEEDNLNNLRRFNRKFKYILHILMEENAEMRINKVTDKKFGKFSLDSQFVKKIQKHIF